MIDFDTQRRYYNRCSPREFLEAGDERYVPVDELSPDDESQRVRGEDWSGKLVRRVLLSDKPVCELLTGLPGSGKSTELRRVAKSLKQDHKYLPIVIDAEEVIDLASEIDIPDIIIALLHHAERGVLEAEGKDPEDAGKDPFWARIKGVLRSISVEVKGTAEVELPFVKLAAEMKYQPSLRDRVRKAVADHVKVFLEEAGRDLLRLNARVETLSYRGLVILFDSMEKLRGTSTNYRDVLSSAEQIFQGGAPYLRLPVHVFYTVPIELISRRRFETVDIMPMIKLHTRSAEEFAPGFAAARQIVTRRIPLDVLSRALGAGELEARLHQLIAWSGGYPRELVRMLQRIMAAEKFPLSEAAFRRVLNEIGDDYQNSIPTSAFPWLARVALDKQLHLEDDDHRRTADILLSSNAILRYLNDAAWFDLHPAVRQLPGVKQEIDKLERERQGA